METYYLPASHYRVEILNLRKSDLSERFDFNFDLDQLASVSLDAEISETVVLFNLRIHKLMGLFFPDDCGGNVLWIFKQ